jgi:hypothetical protein
MGGEELPYPQNLPMHKPGGSLDKIGDFIMTPDDYGIWDKLNLDAAELSYGDAEIRDASIMRARTLCPGVPPARQNLAVFLKYS